MRMRVQRESRGAGELLSLRVGLLLGVGEGM